MKSSYKCHASAILIALFACCLITISLNRSTAWAQAITLSPDESDKYWMEEPSILPEVSIGPQVEFSATDADSAANTGFLENWTNLVYQSGEDGNWEIYFARSDGTGRMRLTNHPATDTQPRLNRGATRIVFVSNRDGNSEIYAINTNGTQLARLTQQGAIDTMPVWSPDGSRIAFVSTRDGNAEIYVMNADGSSPVRIVSTPDDDIYPAWSPNGQQLAWIRAGTSEGQIWIANSDGGDAHAIAYSMYYLKHLSWSPDGTKFAFNFDSRIAVMPIDGIDRRELTTTGNFQPSSWSPDSQRVVYSEFFYRTILDNNKPIQVLDRVENFHTSTGDSNEATVRYLQLFPLDAVLNWQTSDAEPPLVSINPLPEKSRVSGAYVSWNCQERGNSGCTGVDVQVKTDANPVWQDWHRDTLRTGDYYHTKVGEKVFFRAKGRDLARNESPWTGENERNVAFYAWNLSGSVSDNRNIPVVDLGIEIQPSLPEQLKTNDYGRFVTELALESHRSITVTTSGFSSATNSFAAITDLDFHYSLTPSDNLIRNGDFESNSTANWSTSSWLPQVIPSKYFGNYSLALGMYCLPTCFPDMSQFPANISVIDLLVDLQGTVHIVALGDGNRILYYQRPRGSDWSSAQVISTQTVDPFEIYPMLAFDAGNKLQMFWSTQSPDYTFRYFFAEKAAAGNWTKLEMPFHTKNFGVTRSSGRGFHIVYVGTTRFTIYGTWEYGLYYLHPGDGTQARVVASGPKVLDSIYDTWDSPLIAISNDGVIHITWWHQLESSLGKDFYHVYAQPGREFSSVSKALHQSYDHVPNFQTLFIDDLDRLHLQWTEYTNTHEIIRYADGDWTQPTVNLKNEQVKSSSMAGVYQPDTQSDGPFATQIVTIPISMSMPTLAFAYSIDAVTFGESYFAVSLTHEVSQSIAISTEQANSATNVVTETKSLTTTQLFSDSTNTDWKVKWIDMQTWAGQTVTITFGIHQDNTERGLNVLIDQISLGGWSTAVGNNVDNYHFDFGEGGTFIITGENLDRIARAEIDGTLLDFTPIDNQRLQVELPSSLAPGIYTIYLTNTQGTTTAMPAAIQIGQQVWLPVISR